MALCYSNLYLQCDTLTCFGCGVGFDTSIVMQNCLFKANTANTNRNFLLHAPQNNPDNEFGLNFVDFYLSSQQGYTKFNGEDVDFYTNIKLTESLNFYIYIYV